MAQLRIEQVKAPDFSASAELLRSANQSFNAGMDTARGILDSYNEGQQAKGDQALIGALAGLSSEDELASFLASTDLASMNISDTMRQNILGARETILGNNATRQSTVNATDANARANAGEGRVAAEYADSVAARDELRGMTPAYVAALAEGQRYGTGTGAPAGGGTGAAPVADWLVMANEGATRNDPLAPELVDAMSFLGDMGVTMRVVSGGQEDNGPNGTGSTRHNHGNAADADFYIGDRKLDWNNPADLPIFEQIVTQARANGVTGIGAGDDYMGAGRMHVGFGNPGVWGAGGSGENAPDWLRAAYDDAPAGVSRTPVRENPMGGQAAAAFTDALRAGTYMTPDAAAQLFNSVLGQQAQGQDLIAAAEARRQSELGAAATRDAILNPNNLTEADIQRELLATEGLSAANQLGTAGQDLSGFGGVIAPSVREDTQVTDALARNAENDSRTAENDPLLRSFQLAETFDTADDTGAALLEQFDVPEGSGLDSAYVNRRIKDMADAAGISKGEMAAVLSKTSDGSFEQFNAMLSAASDTEMYSTVMSIAERSYGEAARSAYDSRSGEMSRAAADREAAQLEYTTARTRAAKLPIGSEARAAAEAEVANLRDTILKGMTPREREANLRDYVSRTGMASRLQGLDPNSTEFTQAMLQLEEYIKIDTSLTDTEKELLLRDIRG